ncbi:cobalt ABC transporter ATP-binding protein [Vagococcus penaei]|uniref:Cobalt ABC transporter ATP-binding protein n=1 Tax=Vagococcus penaei TaxID=633807 RepID=A0A1Q2D339_9ENTE|nr:ABC transporter ATP-binding protein [Vagococcus penaei]AQP52767.1 cobalt ABC transporter ATP-binding protein [Vagococcus penaei]RST98455.1 cobalt ABC transporter ATP-binding protein [Vagococcus penaei]
MIAIKINQLSFVRGQREIFSKFNAEFEKGTFNLVTGDSGSGKSTLFRLIAGFAQLDYEGEILIKGKCYRHASMQEKAQQIGMLFQNPGQQFTMKTLERELIFALENIGIIGDEQKQRIENALLLGATSELLYREITTLSGGEKQRAALTVLLAMEPEILLLDEPFASIDPTSRQKLIQTLAELRDLGKTIILSDHELTGYSQFVNCYWELTGHHLIEHPLTYLSNEKKNLSLYQTKVTTNSLPILTFKEITIKRGKRKLLDCSKFRIKQGITILTGNNGVGKTTLLRSIAQLRRYQGTMYYHGKKLRKNRRLYQSLSLAVQESEKQFVALTLREELAFNNSHMSQVQEKQLDALKTLGLLDKLDSSLFHLSEGQKKMIQLISLLSLDLSCLLLDEPFAGLDEKACQYFIKWMQEKDTKQSFIIVSHRLEPLSSVSHHHIHLEDQQLIDMGVMI